MVCLWKACILQKRASLLYRTTTAARTATTAKARMPTVIPRPTLDPESGWLLDRAAHNTTTVRHILFIPAIIFIISISDETKQCHTFFLRQQSWTGIKNFKSQKNVCLCMPKRIAEQMLLQNLIDKPSKFAHFQFSKLKSAIKEIKQSCW